MAEALHAAPTSLAWTAPPLTRATIGTSATPWAPASSSLSSSTSTALTDPPRAAAAASSAALASMDGCDHAA